MSQAHAVFDEASLARQREQEQREAQRQILINGEIAAEMTSRYLLENDLGNFEKQAGKKLTVPQFEDGVKKILPSVRYVDRHISDDLCYFLKLPIGTVLRLMSVLKPDGTMQYICSYPKTPFIPEFTIILQKKVKIPTYMNKVSARDFPRVVEYADGSRGFDGDTPFDKYVLEPSGTVPGWRTALARLIGYGFITPTQAENAFGSVDNATWALRLGKQNTSDEVQV